jgi:hypothetical protein
MEDVGAFLVVVSHTLGVLSPVLSDLSLDLEALILSINIAI